MWLLHLLFVYFHLVLVTSSSSEIGELVFVNILFRHGDRTPINPYPKDPYKNNSFWSDGWGQLTNVGKQQQYEVGQWLRQRYGKFLPQEYHREDIHIVSTDIDRTLMSAYSNLAGLYKPNAKKNWNPNIMWTPIPVHTTPEHLDWVLASEVSCKKYNMEMTDLKNSPKFQQINEKNKELYEYLKKFTGINVTNVDDVEMIYDTLFIEELKNFTLPNWTKEVYPQPMKQISEFTFTIPCYTKSLARLKIGPLLGEMLNHMNEKILGRLQKKAWMYSAHDITVANVLKALDVFEPHCPPYRSLILIELRKKNESYYVSIHYRNSTSIPPYLLKLKDCDEFCPFEKFKKILTPLIPEDWEAECRGIRFVENIYDTAASISFFTIVTIALIFLFSLGIALRFYKNQSWDHADFTYKSLNLEVAS